jgi:hypothetical protein
MSEPIPNQIKQHREQQRQAMIKVIYTLSNLDEITLDSIDWACLTQSDESDPLRYRATISFWLP